MPGSDFSHTTTDALFSQPAGLKAISGPRVARALQARPRVEQVQKEMRADAWIKSVNKSELGTCGFFQFSYIWKKNADVFYQVNLTVG